MLGAFSSASLRWSRSAALRVALATTAMVLAASPGHAQQNQGAQNQEQRIQQNFLELSAGTPPPLVNFNVAINNGATDSSAVGAAAGTTNFNSSGNFGNLSRITNGLPSQAVVGLRVRGDLPYTLVVSQISFVADNLHQRGVPLDGSQDRGSFIRMTIGVVNGTGSRSNPQGSQINGILLGSGLNLSQIAFGGVSPAGTVVISGQAPSLPPGTGAEGPGGGGQGAQQGPGQPPGPPFPVPVPPVGRVDDAIEVPLFFTVPTGFALGPVSAVRPGTFSTVLQFGVFPQP